MHLPKTLTHTHTQRIHEETIHMQQIYDIMKNE